VISLLGMLVSPMFRLCDVLECLNQPLAVDKADVSTAARLQDAARLDPLFYRDSSANL
jgi:hypothetical protein